MKALSQGIIAFYQASAGNPDLAAIAVKTAFRDAVGNMAGNAIPVDFSSGVLTVAYRSAAWRNEISRNSSVLISSLNNSFKHSVVKTIKLEPVSRWPQVVLSKQKVGHKSTTKHCLPDSVLQAVDNIEDNRLRQAFHDFVSSIMCRELLDK